ncbi:hypothetical protein GRAN_1553 [Granulicella sibirica]|uniref:Uncharacterized protein n=1 Tax=Granulicella sibirica TaxID=2479048 RepID=A0A4Q0T3Q3_9BACT|nr:hypothetical protein GRAN_1553 [Granulicella sibirica]
MSDHLIGEADQVAVVVLEGLTERGRIFLLQADGPSVFALLSPTRRDFGKNRSISSSENVYSSFF